MKSRIPRISRLAAIVFILGIAFPFRLSLAADHPQPSSGPFETPLVNSTIDNAASAEWFAGAEHPLSNLNALRQLVWTQTDAPAASSMLQFGVANQPGPRSLRLGFTLPVAVGSVLVRGGGQLSVLRPGAAYPGNLADDSQWIPAQRLVNHAVSTASVDQQSYALWVLPSVVKTRALRFTYTSAPTDSSYAGVLGGVYVLSSRMTNLAPQALVTVSANSASAPLLTDEKYNGWNAWDNGPDFRHPVTPAQPEWIILAWPRPVPLAGLAALWAGFNAADAQVFVGPDNASPQDAPDSDWRAAGQPWSLHNQYPRPLGVDWLDFGKTLQTRAVRLRMTAVTDESRHPHLIGKTRNGARVWLGELMALSPLQSGSLETAIQPAPEASGPKPPIPVHFTLDAPGFVTLVIEDAQGNRVRNLVSDTWFAAGANTVWWDGTDDLGRDPDAAIHGVYFIPTHFVAAGTYRVRGIVHQAIDLHYEFTVYNPGHPPWETADTKGGWLSNHTPPQSALFVPAEKAPGGKPLVYLGSYVTEGEAGLAWVDLDGNKQGGRIWVGGNWTAAPFLASDAGPAADPAIFAYVAAAWGEARSGKEDYNHSTLRLTGLTSHGDKSILNYTFATGETPAPGANGRAIWAKQLGGLAVHNSLVAVSLTVQNQLFFANASSNSALGTAPVESPRGLAFDAQGNLCVLSGTRLVRYRIPSGVAAFQPSQLAAPQVLVTSGLEDPTGLTLDAAGNFYIADRGQSNQIKVFSPSGKFLLAIGHAGPPRAGAYDPLHMNNPRGLTIDSNNHLWVAEEDFQPKRVSVWSLDGRLLKAFYGPAEYGGGGQIDPKDKSLFYYHGMEFKLDWIAGSSAISSVYYRPGPDSIPLPRYGDPTTALYANDHRYFTNAFVGNPTQGATVVMLYLDTGGIARPAAAFGKAYDWDLLKGDAFRSRWPQGTDLTSPTASSSVLFTWSDLNNDGKVDPDEVAFLKSSTGAITLMDDLSMIDADVGGKVLRFPPSRVTPAGIPVYDLGKSAVVAAGAQPTYSDGGGQVLVSPHATVMTTAPQPFASESLGGIDNQGHRWSYPSLWPGLHPSHSAPLADQPGELLGTTRLLGGFINPAGSQAGPLWAINGNLGEVYLFTADGLFVAQLFQDMRTGKPWNMPTAQRNMLLNDVSLGGEDFYPSITQTPDGNIYLVDGEHTSVVRVDGLASLRSIPASSLQVTSEQLRQATAYIGQKEAQRQQQTGPATLEVALRSGPAPALKDLIATLKTAHWATIDRRINQIGFYSRPDETQASIAIAGGRLFAVFRTTDPNLLRNSGATPNAPFKTGGALDLMIGADPNADPKRTAPVPGDLRLLVYQVNGQPKATLYRAVVPGTRNPVPFSSPSRTITLDQVQDVSNRIDFYAASGTDAGLYAFSIPLDVLGLKPTPGETIKADMGVLRGDGVQTLQRVYWSNKATGITTDVPSEAELTPNLWGEWIFKAAP